MPQRPDASTVISLMVSLLSISLMSVLFGRKTSGTSLSTVNYARGLVISLYIVSWGFTTIAAILTSTNKGNIISCTLSVFVCLSLYAMSKIIIYLFLIEKVYVVSSVATRRKDTMLYRVNILLLTPYSVILTLMILNRVAVIDDSQSCFIGLKPTASITLILYDIFISCWLTILFIRPLLSSSSVLQGPSKGKLRQVARRTLIGSIIALVLSSANVFTLVYFRGYEDSVLCLLSCTLDVTLNACTIHWVTSRASRSHSTEKDPSRGGGVNGTNNNSHTPINAYVQNYYVDYMPGRSVSPMKHTQPSPTETHISVPIDSYSGNY